MLNRIIAFLIRYLFSALACLWIHTIGIFFARNRSLIARICKHFNYLPESVKPVIPRLDLDEVVFKADAPIIIREPIGVEGNVSLLELYIINQLIRYHNPKTVFEVGTFDGRTVLNMAANTSAATKLYTLDLPRERLESAKLSLEAADVGYIRKESSGLRYRGTDCEKKIVQLYGDSADFDFSSYADDVDFVFIDGSHSYKYVLNDSKLAMDLLNNGKGVIVWHDYGIWHGVTRALNQLYSKDTDFKRLIHINGTSLACLIID